MILSKNLHMFFKITESARIFVNYEDFVNTDFKKNLQNIFLLLIIFFFFFLNDMDFVQILRRNLEREKNCCSHILVKTSLANKIIK